MRKILLISEIFPPTVGGSGRWFFEIYRRLPVGEVVCLVNEHWEAERVDKSFPHAIYREPLSSREWGLCSAAGLKYYLRLWRTLRGLVKSESIQQLHCGRTLPEGLAAYLLNVTHGIPYTCYVHGEDVETAFTSRELKFLTRLVMGRAQLLVANSKNSKRILTEKWQIPESKVLVMYPGVDVEKFSPGPSTQRPVKLQNHTVILTVGRLQKRKGQDMMIKALPALVEQFPDILYVIIGGGNERNHLERMARDLGVSSHVLFLGEVNDEEMVVYYRHCKLFALPNRRVDNDDEGFGMVLLEAQACGRPVLAGASGGTSETFVNGKSGSLINCTTAESLAEGVEKLLSDHEKLDRMGNYGRQYVEQNFSWEILSDLARKYLI